MVPKEKELKLLKKYISKVVDKNECSIILTRKGYSYIRLNDPALQIAFRFSTIRMLIILSLKYCSRRLGNRFQPPGTYVPAGWEIVPRRLEQYLDRYIVAKTFPACKYDKQVNRKRKPSGVKACFLSRFRKILRNDN